MDWSNETVLEFLEAYHSEPVIWDPTHPQHKDKRKLTDGWSRLGSKLDRPVPDLKKKRDSLMATFRGHLRKKKASIRSGAGAGEIYKPLWFAYDYMEEFLAPIYEITANVNTDASVDGIANMSQDDFLAEETVDSPEQLPTQRTSHSAPLSPASAPSTQNRPSVTPRPMSSTPRPMSTIGESQLHQTIRRRRNPPELQQAENQMSQAFDMLNNVVLNKRTASEPDECDLFGQIIAKKLKMLANEEREIMMYDIQGMFIRRRHQNMHSDYISPTINSRPSSASSSTRVSGDLRPQYTDLQSPQSVPSVHNQGSADLFHSSATGKHHESGTHSNSSFTSVDMLASVIEMTFQENQ